MGDVVYLGRTLMTAEEAREANIGQAREQKAAHLAGSRWHLRQLISAMRVAHGDGVAKMSLLEVANEFWPNG
jgi:hypothetical protein